MTIYFQGSELEALWPNPLIGAAGESTAGTAFDATWSRTAAYADDWLQADAGANRKPFWYHERLAPLNSNSLNGNDAYQMWEITDSAGLHCVRGHNNTSERVQMEYWDGAAWVTFGGLIDPHGAFRWDFRIEIGDGSTTPDLVEIYKNEILVASKSAINFLHANFPNGVRYLYKRDVPNLAWGTTQVVITSEPTLDWRVKTIPATADGADVDGTGGFADVSEASIDNATFIALTASGQRRSFKAAARTLVNEIKGFTVAARIRLGDIAAPNQIKPYVKIAGTRYYGTTFALTLGYLNYQYTWNVNPATTFPWTPTQVNDANLEWGWEVV